ncbi:c-type cytochrome [Bdellovibrio bacteriovorus]|uniref:Nitric oxide reductase n=1 Tax=Bdellovibrio bacteriovorus TaxID=959 RepID=A0A150WV14_BDEBC|nr:c-type cytochrome [Bdellovibrio bacteriovorus]KYG70132.1 nitric oxide reductase [Bdellovibrio bacteriovorus]
MLTKSGAKAFFLLGTGLCSLAFVLLTIDTFHRIPAQTNEDQITESVKKGKDLWEHNNCMGCHTLFGEGAYYAPELTKVYQRRGEIFIRQMLKDPRAMYPNDRKMQQYHFTEDEINSLVAFLKWSGEVNLNGFPADPPLAPKKTEGVGPADLATHVLPKPEIFQQMCTACHTLSGAGGSVGPALDGIGNRKDTAWLKSWIKDPKAVKADTTMPTLPLTDAQLEEVVQFLSSQK